MPEIKSLTTFEMFKGGFPVISKITRCHTKESTMQVLAANILMRLSAVKSLYKRFSGMTRKLA